MAMVSFDEQLLPLDAPIAPAAGVYVIDRMRTYVEFVNEVRPGARVRGRMPDVSGVVTIGAEPRQSQVAVTLNTASLDTGLEARDRHLRGVDFLDVHRFPHIHFGSTVVEPDPGGSWEVQGVLTVRDVAHPACLRVDFEGLVGFGPRVEPSGGDRIAFTASTDLEQARFGMDWHGPLGTSRLFVAPSTRIELSVQAVSRPRAVDA